MVMVNQKQIRDDIEHNGYSIAKNAIDKKFISNQRTRWLNYFKMKKIFVHILKFLHGVCIDILSSFGIRIAIVMR